MNDPRSLLLEILARYAYEYRPDEPFVLASGARSPEYLDCRRALGRPEAVRAAGALFHGLLLPEVAAVGGLTMGADPIAISTSCASSATPRPVRWFSVRKEPKGHGQRRTIEGAVEPGDAVAVVDDVVTRGSSTLLALTRCREQDLRVVQILALVDREEGGLDRIRDEVGTAAPVEAIFTKRAIHEAWERLRATAPPAGRVS